MIYDRVVSQYLKHKSSREMPQSKNIKSLSTINMLHHSPTQKQITVEMEKKPLLSVTKYQEAALDFYIFPESLICILKIDLLLAYLFQSIKSQAELLGKYCPC